MASLVSLQLAKSHLRRTDDEANQEIQNKAEEATATILEYLKDQADATWTQATVPGSVQAAILILMAHLFENRGEDMAADEGVWLALDRLLKRRRDPALA